MQERFSKAIEIGDVPGLLLTAAVVACFGPVPFATAWVLITARLDPSRKTARTAAGGTIGNAPTPEPQ